MNKDIFYKINDNINDLAKDSLNLQFSKNQDLFKKISKKQFEHSLKDTKYHLQYLSEAIAYDDVDIFVMYARWTKHLFNSRNLPLIWIEGSFRAIFETLSEELTHDEVNYLTPYIHNAIDELNTVSKLKSLIEENTILGKYARKYTDYLLDADRESASKLIDELLDKDYSVEDIYLDVFAASQLEIGRLWQINAISVAQEHYCTAATQTIMSKLYPLIFSTPKEDKKAVIACTKNELHEIGARMVADFLELYGWHTYYIGAQSHYQSVIESLETFDADILAISATLASHLSEVEELIKIVKDNENTRHIKVIVGGRPFNNNPNLYKKVGANAYAINAKLAVRSCEVLINE